MYIIVVGAGKVGWNLARELLDKGWEDLGGQFTVGAGLETDALVAAGIEKADAFIASTDGDNTNIIIAQIAQKRYEVPTVIARVLDPLRAEWYQRQGLHTVCPTSVAIDMLEGAVRSAAAGGSPPDGAAEAA